MSSLFSSAWAIFQVTSFDINLIYKNYVHKPWKVKKKIISFKVSRKVFTKHKNQENALY